MFAKSFIYSSIVSALVAMSAAVHSAIIISGTRVIYPAEKRDVTVQVKNDGNKPSLMQVWMDNGDASITPDKSNVPFIVNPPVSRVDPKTGQTISLTFTGADLPKDRESVFWMNVLDIPSKPSTSADLQAPTNYLQFSIRSRIKVFYRPENLLAKVTDAPKALKWAISGNQLKIDNPTPYYVNLLNLRAISSLGQYTELASEGLMLAPFQSHNVVLKDLNVKKLSLLSINDYGGTDSLDVDLTH